MNTTIAHSLTQAHGGEALRPIVALVAHDGRKQEMIEWATFNRGTLERCTLYATRTTGKGLGAYLDARINLLLSGPLGGDAQLGGLPHLLSALRCAAAIPGGPGHRSSLGWRELGKLLGGERPSQVDRRRVPGVEEGLKRAGETLRLLPLDEVTAILEADQLAILQQGGSGGPLRDGEDGVARPPEEAHGWKLGDVRDPVEEVPRLAPPADDVAHGA